MNESLKIKTDAWREASFEMDLRLPGKNKVAAYPGQVSPCGQFAIRLDEEFGIRWIITHLNTGLKLPRIADGMCLTESESKAFVERIANLTDWNAINETSSVLDTLGPKVRTIFHEMFLTTPKETK